MSTPTFTPETGPITGRGLIEAAVTNYNAGIETDGMHTILDAHMTAQQLALSRGDGGPGRVRVEGAGFAATTAGGEILRLYLEGYLDQPDDVSDRLPLIRLDDAGKIAIFGSVRVVPEDLDFELVGRSGHGDRVPFGVYRRVSQPHTEHIPDAVDTAVVSAKRTFKTRLRAWLSRESR